MVVDEIIQLTGRVSATDQDKRIGDLFWGEDFIAVYTHKSWIYLDQQPNRKLYEKVMNLFEELEAPSQKEMYSSSLYYHYSKLEECIVSVDYNARCIVEFAIPTPKVAPTPKADTTEYYKKTEIEGYGIF